MLVVIDVVKASLARLFMVVHAFVAVWRVVESKQSMYFWLLLLPLLGLVIDLAYILFKRKGAEWKWFSPSIFFYLGSTLPSIWWLELGRLYKKEAKRNELQTRNSTTGVDMFNEINKMMKLDDDQWTMFVEQSMLLILIISRWLMPLKKNHMTRDQLSQLLLVYLGLAADIVELLAIFDEPGIINYRVFTFAILGAWSWSLMQFTLVLTATRGRAFKTGNKVHDADGPEGEETEVEEKSSSVGCFCCENETWSILVMMMMLDAPFLVLRLVSMTLYKINTYTIYFFTCKNMLVVILQLYRLIIVCSNDIREQKDRQRKARRESDGGAESGRKLAVSRENEDSDLRSRSYRLTRDL